MFKRLANKSSSSFNPHSTLGPSSSSSSSSSAPQVPMDEASIRKRIEDKKTKYFHLSGLSPAEIGRNYEALERHIKNQPGSYWKNYESALDAAIAPVMEEYTIKQQMKEYQRKKAEEEALKAAQQAALQAPQEPAAPSPFLSQQQEGLSKLQQSVQRMPPQLLGSIPPALLHSLQQNQPNIQIPPYLIHTILESETPPTRYVTRKPKVPRHQKILKHFNPEAFHPYLYPGVGDQT